MYCSVKFLSPMVTGGLPTPGPADALVDVPVPAGVTLPPELDDLLPHAARATTNPTAVMPANSFLMVPPPLDWIDSCSSAGLRDQRRNAQCRLLRLGKLQSSRGEQTLHPGHCEVHRQCQPGD